ncbi:MAG TPA: hypothetical protein VGK55_12295, partial [Actinomycetes bacterium]
CPGASGPVRGAGHGQAGPARRDGVDTIQAQAADSNDEPAATAQTIAVSRASTRSLGNSIRRLATN